MNKIGTTEAVVAKGRHDPKWALQLDHHVVIVAMIDVQKDIIQVHDTHIFRESQLYGDPLIPNGECSTRLLQYCGTPYQLIVRAGLAPSMHS